MNFLAQTITKVWLVCFVFLFFSFLLWGGGGVVFLVQFFSYIFQFLHLD